MLKINVNPAMTFDALNEKIRESNEKHIQINDCTGQRYIGAGLAGRQIDIEGTPGNALGAYLNGSVITVQGNVQDATGDTMNGGEIVVYGSAGDATGYAMRGGAIYIRGNTGYRAGIHMKAYKDQQPAVVIGGEAGCFLGEYQAGGTIIVLCLDLPKYVDGHRTKGSPEKRPDIGSFVGTGMHGGAIYIRTDKAPDVPQQINVEMKNGADIPAITEYVKRFCTLFDDVNYDEIINSKYAVLTPNTLSPYKQLYTQN